MQLLAAVRYRPDQRVDAVLEEVVRSLVDRGVRVAGYLQRETPPVDGCCSTMHLEDVETGDQVRISQALGTGSRGCRLDPQGLEHATGLLLSRLEDGADLIVLNRFGKGESDGRGFRAVVEAAFARQMPVLTAVHDNYADAWRAFGGGLSVELPLDRAAIMQWSAAVGIPSDQRKEMTG